MKRIIKEIKDTRLLLRSIPSLVFALFVISIIAMNLLANKAVKLPFDFLAFDCGIIISWIAFLTNDVITKHFGPKASCKVTIVAIFINLVICLLFFIASKIPGTWSMSNLSNENIVNPAIDKTIGSTWYVVIGSTIAFLIASIINSVINYLVGKLFKKNPDSFIAFASRSYVSTIVSQFLDNFIFSLLVSHVFFDWSIIKCISAAAIGMILELLFEILFSPLGYKICKNWAKDDIGREYLERSEKN